jgi:hypothetical protein
MTMIKATIIIMETKGRTTTTMMIVKVHLPHRLTTGVMTMVIKAMEIDLNKKKMKVMMKSPWVATTCDTSWAAVKAA